MLYKTIFIWEHERPTRILSVPLMWCVMEILRRVYGSLTRNFATQLFWVFWNRNVFFRNYIFRPKSFVTYLLHKFFQVLHSNLFIPSTPKANEADCNEPCMKFWLKHGAWIGLIILMTSTQTCFFVAIIKIFYFIRKYVLIQIKAKSFTSQVAHGASAYLRFVCSVKRMRVFDSPWMGH